MVDQQEQFLNSRRSEMVKTVKRGGWGMSPSPLSVAGPDG